MVIGVAGADPFAWEPHLVAWAALVVLAAAVVGGHRRLAVSAARPIPWTRRQRIQFAGAVLAAAVGLTWPLADLAAQWSLTALVVQRVLMVLVVAPLLVLGLPYDIVQWATRPAAVDAVLLRLHRPPVAIATVTVVLVGSMTPWVVHGQATSLAFRAVTTVLVVAAGIILWLPVLGRIPGTPRLKPVVRFAYLIAQAVVPAFLSFIYIFSTHPLYAEFARSHRAIGLRPLNDQQIAGFVSKLSMLLVLLCVGGVVLARASTSEDELSANDPLVWADVERQFERADRRDGGFLRERPDGGVEQENVPPPPSSRSPGTTPGSGDRSGPGTDPPPGGRPPEQGR